MGKFYLMENSSRNFENALAIGDVAKIIDMPEHTIRFWEKEFIDFLTPARTKGRQRRYFDSDIEMLKKIKDLLKVQGFSIKGAKKMLGNSTSSLSQLSEINSKPNAFALQIAELVASQLSTAQVA